MRKEDMNIAIGVAGLAAAILLFGGGKGAADSAYGGAFPTPIGEGAGDGLAELATKKEAAMAAYTPTPGQTINPFSEWGISFTESAKGTIAETQGSVNSFLGGAVTKKTSLVQIPAWMGGEDFTRNVLKLKSEGYTYQKIDRAGAFIFSKTIETKKEATIASGGSGSYGSGALSGSSRPVTSSQQGGATVYTQSSGGSGGGGSRSGFSSGW